MKKILITGGMSGLWKEMGYLAVQQWYHLDILDISEGEIWTTLPSNMNYIHCDISQIDTTTVEKLSGSYDIVICNAGISLSGNFLEHDLQANKKLMQINTLWHIELIRLLLSQSKIKKWAHIGCIASASEMLPFPVALWYAASKWALRSFWDSLRSYLISRQISVSIVYPWPMPTAHVKYYGKQVVHGKTAQNKIQKVARNTLKGIIKWRRNIYPDPVSKVLAYLPLPRFVLDRVMSRVYREEIGGLS